MIASDPSLAASTCACGSTTVFAVRPGVEAVRLDAVDLFTRRDKAVEAGVVCVCFCLSCWRKRWGVRAA